ncbi:MAG: polyprenyl synthetase family protein [Candidatus Micrarchaeota archaeon]|nr:polyprenyl synthetase family protein [Candidatus Micrarchaeota archaeon]
MVVSELETRVASLNRPVRNQIWKVFGRKRAPWEVYGLLSEFLLVEGKRLRPALCIATCSAVGGKPLDSLHAASAIEMFHNFTLIHDDIEDSSLLRRGKPCMYVKYGLPLAMNAGDGLFMMVWREALGIGGARSLEAQRRMLAAFTNVLEGQAIELGWYHKNNWDIGEKQYYQMVRGKTGALIAASCEVGALLGGADEKTCEAMRRFGMGIGVGFQIIDDVLNLVGDEKTYKKEIGGDISEGKRTLMTIWALRRLPKPKAGELRNIMKKKMKSKRDVARAVKLISQSGAIELAANRAKRIVSEAIAELDTLPNSRAKRDLVLMAEYITKRKR